MKTILRALFIIAATALALFSTGCTHMMDVKPKVTALPDVSKLRQDVALVLDKDLHDFKYEMKMMGDKFLYPFGPALETNAQAVVEHNFQKVVTYPSIDAAASGVEPIIVTLRGVKAESSTPVFAWDKARMTLVVEWTARDRASRNTIWLKTITAEATETAGNAFTGSKHQRIQMQSLFDDFANKSQAAIQAARELNTSAK